MAVDTAHVGTALRPVTAVLERGRVRAFSRSTGQTDPVYLDIEAARARGHRDLPVPPTMLFAIELEQDDPFAWLSAMGVDLRFVLHGEQRFDYHRVAHAGEELTATSRVTDVYSKRGGALDFVVKATTVTAAGGPVAELTTVIVVRNPDPEPDPEPDRTSA